MPEPQTFDEAISLFQDFLRQNGYSANLLWVEPADVLIPFQGEIYVRLPVSTTNVDHARHLFTRGISSGLGIRFGTICALRNATCCHAWVPKDLVEQERRLMGVGLKLQAKTDRLTGTEVKNWFRWLVLQLCHRKFTSLNEILFG
jgi:hypothetical protein